MKYHPIFLVLFAILLIPIAPVSAQISDDGDSLVSRDKIIKAIEVKGNKTIGVTTIISKIKTRVGEPYYQNVISDDLKRLYNTGYFSDVSVDRQDLDDGLKVIIYLVEKPIVEKLTFSKTRKINSRSIMRKMKTQKGKFLNNKALNDDVGMIEDMYAKKGLTTVSVVVEKQVDEATNKAQIHIVIKEGERIKIKAIQVYGNKAFSDRKIRRIIKTRADSLFTSGYLKEDVIEEDMSRVGSFYEQHGFIDSQADFKLENVDDNRLVLKINIVEGKQYFIEKVTISGNDVLSEFEIRSILEEVIPGKEFSRERLTLDMSNIRTLYFDNGYIFANVRESTSLDSITGKVNVKLEISEGDLAYINKIKIQGNTRTRDIVIRRELRLLPGDRFDGGKLRRSKDQMRGMGYFEDINYDIEPTDSPTKKNLVVQVKEAKTGTLSFGGGFSTVDQVVGFIEVQQKNFDFTNWPTFTGGGQSLTIRAETGSTRNNARISFTEPWIFDYPVAGGFDAYRTEREKEQDVGYAYDEERMGGGLRFGKQFTEHFSGGVNYKHEDVTISNLDSDVSADLAAEEGDRTVSMIGFNVKEDRRDSVFSPTKGFIAAGSADYAGGGLGGDTDIYRVKANGSYFIPFKFDSVLEFRVRTGIVDAHGDSSTVPIFERFFAGGARSVRGYDERKVGPIDSVTEDPIGGEAMLVGNIEYVVPVIEFLKLATFFDIGNVWPKIEDIGDGDFKAGVGVGLRVKTPIGPVNLDYGYPLDDEPGEEEKQGKFYFSVSRGF